MRIGSFVCQDCEDLPTDEFFAKASDIKPNEVLMGTCITCLREWVPCAIISDCGGTCEECNHSG